MITKYWAGMIRRSINDGRSCAARYGKPEGRPYVFGQWVIGLKDKQNEILIKAYETSYEKALALRFKSLTSEEINQLHKDSEYAYMSLDEQNRLRNKNVIDTLTNKLEAVTTKLEAVTAELKELQKTS